MAKTLDDLVKAAFGEQMLAILHLQVQVVQLQEQLAKTQTPPPPEPPKQ